MQTYDLQKIEQLLKDFYNLTGLKACFYDSDERELCFYPEKLSGFCALLRKDAQMDERCKACDQHAFAVCKKTHKQYVYTCHAGLLECVSPILYDNKLLGFIVLGQIKKSETDTPYRHEKSTDEETHKELYAHFQNLPFVGLEKINSAMRILDACTGYEYLKSIAKETQGKIDVALGEYIDMHIDGDLCVQTLCSKFHLSHSEIYSIFKEYFHATPAEFVKFRRLQKACDLLKYSDLPVNKIAVACGIPDYNYFSKIFKRQFGISPRQHRKQS